jgi:hypothetical protein
MVQVSVFCRTKIARFSPDLMTYPGRVFCDNSGKVCRIFTKIAPERVLAATFDHNLVKIRHEPGYFELHNEGCGAILPYVNWIFDFRQGLRRQSGRCRRRQEKQRQSGGRDRRRRRRPVRRKPTPDLERFGGAEPLPQASPGSGPTFGREHSAHHCHGRHGGSGAGPARQRHRLPHPDPRRGGDPGSHHQRHRGAHRREGARAHRQARVDPR